MTLGALTLGDVSTTCGANPCGFLDFFGPSADCSTWQQCAAAYNAGAPVVPAPCVTGGLDANGNTIVSCGGTPTNPVNVDWSNPNAPVIPGTIMPTGDTYAGPVTTVAQIQADIASGAAIPKQVGAMPYVMLGVVVLAFLMIGGRR